MYERFKRYLRGLEERPPPSTRKTWSYPRFSIFFGRKFSFFTIFENYFCRMERYPGVRSWTIPKAYMSMRGPKGILMWVDLVSRLQGGQNRRKWAKNT